MYNAIANRYWFTELYTLIILDLVIKYHSDYLLTML